MIRIEAIKAIIHTNNGLFGRSLKFQNGLNIVRANNTTGKSSLFGAVIYGLGFEEILGGRNEKALQSVFKSVIKDLVGGKTFENTVIQSEIYLQVSNGTKSITTKRFALHDKIKPQAVEVYLGAILTDPGNEVQRLPMYVHDKGGASNDEIGFHKFLEEFIGASLPDIINQEGRRIKLFLPLIATAHFIEQKAGWSDFFANMPYYGVRDASAKVFEYILDFDIFEIAATRQEVQNRLKVISENWGSLQARINAVAKKGGAEVIGLSNNPEILTKETKPYLRFLRGEETFLINELIAIQSSELETIVNQIRTPANVNLGVIEEELGQLKYQTNRYEIMLDTLSSDISQNRETLRQYFAQLKNIEEDLRKNKDAEKLQKIGLEFNLKSGSGICPTCNQHVNDTLLHENIPIVPMGIDQNISYLQAQRKMVEAFIANIEEQIKESDLKKNSLETAIQNNRQRIRTLKRTLVSDDRLPSEAVIERKVVLERELNFLYRLREEFETYILELYRISDDYRKEKGLLSNASREYLSTNDIQKLTYFESHFRELLRKFGFTSKQLDIIGISHEKYLPVYKMPLPNGVDKQVDIRFESSASDFIRAQWAYYLSLMHISIRRDGNHFQVLMLDEPQQQSAANENFKAFLKELEQYNQQQTIVFASFQNSDEDFMTATDGLKSANIVDFTKNNKMVFTQTDS